MFIEDDWEGGCEDLVVNKRTYLLSGEEIGGDSSDPIFQIVKSLTTHANAYNFMRQEKGIRQKGTDPTGWCPFGNTVLVSSLHLSHMEKLFLKCLCV